MSSLGNLRKSFDECAAQGPFRAVPEIAEAGLTLGFGTVLVRRVYKRRGESLLALDMDEERLLALTSAVYGRQMSPKVMHFVRRASEQLRRGDRVLAQIELAFARFPRLEGREDAFRLFLAEDLLANGFTPRRLTRELGFDPRLLKYDPNQSRVPAGHGRESGEWGSAAGSQQVEGKLNEANLAPVASVVSEGKSGEATIAPAASAIVAAGISVEAGTLANGLFTAAKTSAFLEGLAILAPAIGTRLVFGALFTSIPGGNNVAFEGQLPDDPDLHYTFRNDEASLQIWRQQVSGREIVATARRVGPIYYEAETGIPIARQIGTTIVFDADSLASVAEYSRPQTLATRVSTTRTEEPQLCPDPGPDVPHGSSLRAIQYQAFISFLNNPDRPLPPGMAVSLPNPDGGRRVVYDDCRESDGTMIEAKGPGFANMLKSEYMRKVLTARWGNQGARQVAAAGWRGNDWFFAEQEAANFAREVFEKRKLEKIKVIPMPFGDEQ
jgi:hypothetical protein